MSVWCVSEGKGQRKQEGRHPQQESSYGREGKKKNARMRDLPLSGKVLGRRRASWEGK